LALFHQFQIKHERIIAECLFPLPACKRQTQAENAADDIVKINKYSLLTMAGHICTDINQGALPAVLPFLVLHKNISYASAAGLIFAANSVSSLIQPLLGYLGDKISWPWLMGLGVLLAGGGLALVGFLDQYWAIFIAVMISGVGIALFHPEGGKIAHLVAGEKKGSGIAIFSVGGNIGFALGPVIASIALTVWGLRGTAVFLAPAAVMAAVVLLCLPGLHRILAASAQRKAAVKNSTTQDDWPSFVKVSACITGRSVVSYGLTTFIPLYFAAIFMLPEVSASARLTLFSIVAAAATLFGGYAADRIGFTRVIRGGFTLLAPLLFLLPVLESVRPATLLLIPIAFAVSCPQGASIALGQKFLPNHIGTSSGIMLGLAVSVGGMAAPGIGWIGDHYGLPAAMYTIAAFSLLTLLLACLVPNSGKPAKPRR
jgi:FSR family fosmidomycin resistance protein-like MFS transporter